MFTRTNLIFLGILFLAIAGTVGVMIHSRTTPGTESGVSGKLSEDTIEIEKGFKDFQQKWKENEAVFKTGDPKSFGLLGHLQTDIKSLADSSKKLKGLTAPECDAIVHLSASIDASAKVLDPYLLLMVNKAILAQKHWDEAKVNAEKANREWKAWVEATRNMSR